jgi:hypothetical protein
MCENISAALKRAETIHNESMALLSSPLGF